MRQALPGQSLQEYGILFGLVVVLSIPAISGLGGQVFNSLNATGQQQDNFNQLVGLLGGPGNPLPGGGGLFRNGMNGSQFNLGGQNFSFSQNENGGIVFSDGSNTTSIEGSTVMQSLADEINQITANPEMLSQLSNSDRNKIEKMADLAHKLAVQQRRLEAGSFVDSTNNNAPENLVNRFSEEQFTEAHKDLNKAYREFYDLSISLNNSSLAEEHPEVMSNINFLSNLGQNIAYQNFLAPEAVDSWYNNLLSSLNYNYTDNFKEKVYNATLEVMEHHSDKKLKPPAVSLAELSTQAGSQETTQIANQLEQHAEPSHK